MQFFLSVHLSPGQGCREARGWPFPTFCYEDPEGTRRVEECPHKTEEWPGRKTGGGEVRQVPRGLPYPHGTLAPGPLSKKSEVVAEQKVRECAQETEGPSTARGETDRVTP